MRKLRIYIDTSVIGGCFDEEFSEWSNKLFDEFIEGKKIAVVSDIVLKEVANAPENVKNKLNEIPLSYILIVEVNKDIELLADAYINAQAISGKYYDDSLHIASATYYQVDVLVSWNFKHIVNFNRILKYNSVNLMNGYKTLEIRNPKEVISNEEEF
jgi:predicted nucleic acid-binding protein